MCRDIKTLFSFEPPAIDVTAELLALLVTTAVPRDREAEAARAHARAVRRFGA